MGKIGPKFSQIVSVRLEGGDPPSKAVSLTAFSVFFFKNPGHGIRPIGGYPPIADRTFSKN